MSNQDQDHQWVIFELNRDGEEKNPDTLVQILEDSITEDLDFFIPSTSYTKDDDEVTVSLMEGYLFAKKEDRFPSSVYFEVEDSPYIKEALSRRTSNGKRLIYTQQENIDSLKEKLHDRTTKSIEEGDEVMITGGAWENLKGEVIGKADPDQVDQEDIDGDDLEYDEGEEIVYIDIEELASIDSIVTIPKGFLKKLD